MDVEQVVDMVAGGGHGKQVRFKNAVNAALDAIWQAEGLQPELKPAPLSQVTVWSWLNRRQDRLVPPEYVRAVVYAARAAGVDLNESEVRPDIYGAFFSGTAA